MAIAYKFQSKSIYEKKLYTPYHIAKYVVRYGANQCRWF
jgi:hypothetical protein